MGMKKLDFFIHAPADEVIRGPTFTLFDRVETTCNQPLKYTSQVDKGANTNSVSGKADCSMEVCTVVWFNDLSVGATFVVGDIGQGRILSNFLDY
jgi:hypothetical protein